MPDHYRKGHKNYLIPYSLSPRLHSFLDKANLGNAKVAGLETDLNLTSTQYSIALTILYPSYMLVELPASLLLKRLGPHRE